MYTRNVAAINVTHSNHTRLNLSQPPPPPRLNRFTPSETSREDVFVAIPQGFTLHFRIARVECDVIGVTDVSGYATLNTESYLGCIPFQSTSSECLLYLLRRVLLAVLLASVE